jgi:hypothetical protein
MFKTYELKPKTIEAVHFPKAGTYKLPEATVVIEEDDTYIVKTIMGYESRKGTLFRLNWQEVSKP